ncbi:MAG: nitrite/sulfite reductase, partial [Rhodocyclaceae bacterium]|nr:nitrite/sulfite reductase [Rhodocyclaceae bacterium]
QNLILPDVKKRDLYNLWQEARKAGLATATVGLLTDIVACPGADYCSLASARSLPLAAALQARFADAAALAEIGPLRLNLSGCVNACGHHHVGAIGLLGIDKGGEERYQLVLGGATGAQAALGEVIGPSFAVQDVPQAVARLVDHYRAQRRAKETFLDTLRRVGRASFIAAAYGKEPSSHFDTEREVANG